MKIDTAPRGRIELADKIAEHALDRLLRPDPGGDCEVTVSKPNRLGIGHVNHAVAAVEQSCAFICPIRAFCVGQVMCSTVVVTRRIPAVAVQFPLRDQVRMLCYIFLPYIIRGSGTFFSYKSVKNLIVRLL